jgi:hypothetical protein
MAAVGKLVVAVALVVVVVAVEGADEGTDAYGVQQQQV